MENNQSIMERIFNLTPHDIHLYTGDKRYTIPVNKHYSIPRMTSSQAAESYDIVVNDTLTLPVRTHTLKDFEDVFSAGDIIITSMLCAVQIADKLKDRNICVLSPDTSPESVVRDDKGCIIGVQGFIIYN